ncbi:C-C chemokine receptor type 5-like, partial [Clinocottus analis]|uniref:C-C chemokine receptor type 5-like n=1 Tax=Clinocottus analis TaxID=304258 RepID=UPI0035C10051
ADRENVTVYDYSAYYDDSASFSPCSNDSLLAFSQVFLPVVYSLVFVLGFVGNGLVVCVLLKHRRQTNMTDVCLFNLAVADLVFVLTLPLYSHYFVVGRWPFGDLMCRLASGCHSVGFFGSIFFMVAMTLDRYLVIMHAHKVARHRTLRAGVALSVSVWTLGTCVSLPAVVFARSGNDSDGVPRCRFEPASDAWRLYNVLSINVLGLAVPLLVMVVCYSRIVPILLSMRSAKKHRAVKLIVCVVVAFFVFWAPFNVSLLLDFLDAGESDCGGTDPRLMQAMTVTETVAFAHCCLNPIIYAFVGQKFRRRVAHMLKKLVPGEIVHLVRGSFGSSYRKSSVTSRSSDTTSNFIM